jgi:thiamine-phosphate pyrophosphorylase
MGIDIKKFPYGFYLVTNRSGSEDKKSDKIIEGAIKGGVTCVQLREKNLSFSDFVKVGKKIKAVTDYFNIPLIVNDRVDVALEIKAAGVHIGKNDSSLSEVRKILGHESIVGITIESLDQLEDFLRTEQRIDYFGVSAIFPSKTKKDVPFLWSREEVKNLYSKVNIPLVAIGGIDQINIQQLKEWGFSGFAVSSAICDENNEHTALRKGQQLSYLIAKLLK